MNGNAFVRACALVLAMSLGVSLIACDNTSKVRKLADGTKPLLKSDLVVMQGEHLVPESTQLVLLIGENHASVKTQQELATLVANLLDARQLDGLLLEGTLGPVEEKDLKDRLSAVLGADSKLSDAHWREQLDAGLIAGYEYVALTRPRFDIVGVEDMGAKARNASALSERGLLDAPATYLRGADLLDKALAAIRAGKPDADVAPVLAEIAAARQAAVSYANAVPAAAQEMAGMWRAQKAVELLKISFVPAAQRLFGASPSFAERQAWAREADSLIAEGRALSERLERKRLDPAALDPLNPSVSEILGDRKPGKSRPTALRPRHAGDADALFSTTVEEQKLASISQQLEPLSEKIKDFDAVHAADLAVLQAQSVPWKTANENRESAAVAIRPTFERIQAAEGSAADAYFIAANSLRTLSNGGDVAVTALSSFFRDERERARLDSGNHSELLAERDAAMAKNTVDYLKEHDKKIVLLLVGYAHVAGIEKQLAASNVSYLSGMVASSKTATQPWEDAAWVHRRLAGRLAFAERKQLKEVPLLQNDAWKEEQVAKLKAFNELAASGMPATNAIEGLAWDTRIYEGVGGSSRSLRVGKFPFDRSADVGDHVLDRGPVPGKAGEFFELFDRKLAGDQVDKLSDLTTQFAYYYQTPNAADPTAGHPYRIRTPGADRSFQEFIAKPPGGRPAPSRIVLFGESDEVMQGDVAVSPLWGQLQSGNSGPPPPPVPPRANSTSSGEPPRRARGWLAVGPLERPKAQVLRTINPARARLHLNALDKQRAERVGNVTFLNEVDMARLQEKLLFTPQRGDNAQMVVVMGRNIPELRAAVRAAGEAKLLVGKQVALIMCGDSFGDTAALRESLLREGALMVWSNDRQVTPEAGSRLADHVMAVIDTIEPDRRRTIDDLMRLALQRWRQQLPQDAGIAGFMFSATYVLLERDGVQDGKETAVLG